jgi:aminodeoxyfutalosine deaminase
VSTAALPSDQPRARHAGDDLATLPKVELHVHLEGSVDAATAVELAEGHGEDVTTVLELEDGGYPRRFRDFDHFVATFLATSGLVRTPDDLATVAAAFARGQAAQRVRWTEATFTALTLARQGMEPRAMFRALTDGFAEAPDVRIGVIVDSIRNLGVDASHETLRLVEEFGDEAPIVGLGLTGIEGSVPERDFLHLREAATRLGLGLAVQAGETGPPEAVRAALDDLGADRIGHGIATVRDRDLLERVVRDQVPLEVCPSSNVTLSIVDRLDDHPLVELWEAGANVTINSDDPPFFGTTLTDELDHARRLCALERKELAELQRRAARASFAPPKVTRDVLARIDAWATGSAI